MLMLAARSPIVVLYGSAFPMWIFAALAGVIFAVLLRQLLLVFGVAMPWAALFYPAFAIIFGIWVYVLWIGGYAG